ncbi:MAG: AsmA-like C-terminal region-containing protein, partial [Candidatus Binatia bacterium]
KQLRSLIGGGTLNGRLDLRARRKTITVSTAMKIDHMDLGRMLKALDVEQILEGKLDVDLDLHGRGGSVAALMAGLKGKIIMVVGEGRINHSHIEVFGEDLGSSLLRLLTPSKQEAKYTRLNCLVSRFDIKDGLAKSTVLLLDTKEMTVAGGGKVDLKTEKLDLSMKPSPKKGLGIKGVGKLSLSLGELTKPVKLGGTLAKPLLVVDPTRTVIAIGKMFGGMLLFGPLGAAAGLASGSSADENPCLTATQAARKRGKVSSRRKGEHGGSVEEPTEDFFGSGKGAFESIGDTFKKLFGK